MKLEFNAMETTVLEHFYGGEKALNAKMHVDELCRILQGRLEPGASIGMHTHEQSSEIIFILSGTGKVLFDDGEEALSPGDCHYCPKGHSHSLINNGTQALCFYAVVPNQ